MPGHYPPSLTNSKNFFCPPRLLSTDFDTNNSLWNLCYWMKKMWLNPLIKIEECAAKRQANIDSGKEVIVGVNKYKLDTEDKIDVLVIDNKEVKTTQLARLDQVRNLIS